VTIYRAVVRHGRLVLDEPTDLPEGTPVELEEVDPYKHLDPNVDLDSAEQERLDAAIDKGLAQLDAGQGVDLETVLRDLRQRSR